MGRCWSKGTKVQLCRMTKSRDLMYSMMAILNVTLNAGNAKISAAVIIQKYGNCVRIC